MFAGLVGGIVWNLLSWLLGISSSSSHALIGGIVGAMIAAVGGQGVIWHGLVSMVILPALLAPTIALTVATVGAWLVYRSPAAPNHSSFPTQSLLAISSTHQHRRNMAHLLALISYARQQHHTMPPLWVIVSCAWRSRGHLPRAALPHQARPVDIESPSMPQLSTSLLPHFLPATHVATGSILGSGVGKPGAEVRWAVAGRMVTAWLITLPSAGIVGAATYYLVHGIGGYTGAAIGFGLLIAVATGIWLKSRQAPITHENVTHEWQGNLTAGIENPQQQDSASAEPIAEPVREVTP